MHKLLTTSTSSRPLGLPSQHKLLTITEGPYAGRRIALLQSAPHVIQLVWSDSPRASWSAPLDIVTDCEEASFDCTIDSDGNIYLVYTAQAGDYLTFRKLTFVNGAWQVGAAVTIYNGAAGYDPSILRDATGNLWVSYSQFITPNRTIRMKQSTDDGAIWGTGPDDPGDSFHTAMFAYSRLALAGDFLFILFVDEISGVFVRSRHVDDTVWSVTTTLESGSGFTSDFDCAVSPDGRLGVVYKHDELKYREFDSDSWSVAAIIDSATGFAPNLIFRGNTPLVAYRRLYSGAHSIAMFSERIGTEFSEPALFDPHARPFENVVLYHQATAQYNDLTSEADSVATADIFHDDSGCLLKVTGDCLYLGLNDRFRQARLILSTTAQGGGLLCTYWNGHDWQAFTPQTVTSPLTDSPVDLMFWQDYASIPADWQICTVNGSARFWIRIVATADFTVGPVASQITAASNVSTMILGR